MGMPWFKHLIKDSQFIDELVLEYGGDGYYVYYRTIEVMAINYDIKNRAENLFHWDYYFGKFYKISKKKLQKILFTCSEKYKSSGGEKGIHFEEWQGYLFLKCIKLEGLADRWTKETVRKLSSDGTVDDGELDGIDKEGDKERDKEGEKDKKNNVLTEIEIELVTLLKDKILKNNPKAKPKESGWYKSLRLMIIKDERKPDDIKATIEWSQKNEFWRCNILSMGKLRDKFDMLTMQMKRDKDNGTNKGHDKEPARPGQGGHEIETEYPIDCE